MYVSENSPSFEISTKLITKYFMIISLIKINNVKVKLKRDQKIIAIIQIGEKRIR